MAAKGKVRASYLVRVTVREDENAPANAPLEEPTIADLETAITAAVLEEIAQRNDAHFEVRSSAERTDR